MNCWCIDIRWNLLCHCDSHQKAIACVYMHCLYMIMIGFECVWVMLKFNNVVDNDDVWQLNRFYELYSYLGTPNMFCIWKASTNAIKCRNFLLFHAGNFSPILKLQCIRNLRKHTNSNVTYCMSVYFNFSMHFFNQIRLACYGYQFALD